RPAAWDEPTILIGAEESYEARCRRCHQVRSAPQPGGPQAKSRPQKRPLRHKPTPSSRNGSNNALPAVEVPGDPLQKPGMAESGTQLEMFPGEELDADHSPS